MDKALRTAIGNAAQDVRALLERDLLAQLEATFDVSATGVIADAAGAHLDAKQRRERDKIVGALEYHRASGLDAAEAVARFVRDAAFTLLNRFVALKLMEARGLLQQCVSKGPDSAGFREFIGLAPGVAALPENAGYRLYLESLFDELSTEIKVLFDRHDTASLLWPRSNAFDALLAALNEAELGPAWVEDETIGWFYQFFNSAEERKKMRDESPQAPRNSRELAVRNQFFTPRYVVQFLVDNSLGRTWLEMHPESGLAGRCEYLVELDEERSTRAAKDPRDFRILDPACGSGHFLLYAFDLLEQMYREAWHASSTTDEHSLKAVFATEVELAQAIPRLVLERNLYGVDIDPRAAQIAALALWLRAQRAWQEGDVAPADRPIIRRTGVVVAEPMPGDPALLAEFADSLDPPLLGHLFRQIVASMRLAGEMGTLLRPERELADEIARARKDFVNARVRPQSLPGFGSEREQGELDLSGIDDDAFFLEAEQRLVEALHRFAAGGDGSQSSRRKMFADDAGAGVALVELLRHTYDVVLMNPPFGAGSLKAKKVFDAAYPRTKNDVYAAFVERGIELLVPRGMLGAITSRTGFFLSSFQKWREEIILDTAPPLVFADLGMGVMDAAMVEAAAYVLERER